MGINRALVVIIRCTAFPLMDPFHIVLSIDQTDGSLGVLARFTEFI